MFERFTDHARRVVVLAQQEARVHNHAHIGPEHLLLALLGDRLELASSVLEAMGVSQDGARQLVQAGMVPGTGLVSGHMPFTHDAKQVLELALREAQDLGHSYIGTEHVLLGLIRLGEGPPARILAELGLDLERTRAEVRRLASVGRPTPVAEDTADRLSRIEQHLAALDARLTAVERHLNP